MSEINLENILKDYEYDFPEDLIAKSPVSPRDAARLMVYKRHNHSVSDSFFSNLPDFLPDGSVLVFNETKVLPARIILNRETGGIVKLLFVGTDKDCIKMMSDRKLTVGSKLFLGQNIFTVKRQEEKYFFILPPDDFINEGIVSSEKIFNFLESFGDMPIPPYIKNSPLDRSELIREYQTVFAKDSGSVAAPTASLHFTDDLLDRLKDRGFSLCFITLHVGIGTFAPLTEENIKNNRLHKEWFSINPDTANILNEAKSSGKNIIAVGTTALRALESASSPAGVLEKLEGETNLFISEGYKFKFINGLITNFHVPKSSLMMLVAALIGREKLLELYQRAVSLKYRFFSFGDGMLII